jgi:ATP-binding cassette, subfamily B, bacterial
VLGSTKSQVERLQTRWRESTRRMVLTLIPGAGRGLCVALALLVVAEPVLSFAFMVAVGHLVGNVPGAVQGGFDSDAGRRLLTAVGVLGTTFVLSHALNGTRYALAETMGRRVNRIVRTRLLTATLGPPGVAHVEDPEILDKVAVARSDTIQQITPGLAAEALVHVTTTRLRVIPPFLLVASYRWWLAVLVAGVLFWMRQVMRAHILETVRVHVAQAPLLRKSYYFIDLALTPGAAKETRVFGLARWLGERFESIYLHAIKAVWADRAKSRRRLPIPLLATLAVHAFAFSFVVRAAVRGTMDLTSVTILIEGLFGLRNIMNLSNEDVQLEHGSASLPSFFEVERLMAERQEAITGDRPADGLPQTEVRFEGVRFHYPGSSHEVYNGLDLDLRVGESLAVVGVNGAGKTTLVKLLARLHDPAGGRITVDGIDLRDIDPSGWQRRVAAIFQDFTRYELPLRDNVGFGALHLANDDDALRDAIEQAGANDVLQGLSHGLDTVLSRGFTDGTDLSGGQWQRVALARALLAVRGGAGILVLDEPTANLDVRAEAELYDRFLELTRGVTTIVISHRFSTVRRADRIVVLDQGRVAEAGTHAELVALDGHYARMFQLQAARFVDDVNEAAEVADA